MQNHHPKAVEDYTQFALFMLFVNLLWIFTVIWWVLGLLFVMVTGATLNHLITRLKRYREARERRITLRLQR